MGETAMRKTSGRVILILMISLGLLVLSGCADPGQKSDSDASQEKPPLADSQEDPVMPAPPTLEEENKHEVSESDRIPGWKMLNARVSISELTDHGSQPLNDGRMVGFSIHFPGSWTLDSSVIYNADNKKTAEIPPVVLLKIDQEEEFLDYTPVMDEELISHQVFNTESCLGSKTITRIDTESGSWYPHIYRLIDENYGFTMVLYSEELNTEDEALYDEIMDTFSFRQ